MNESVDRLLDEGQPVNPSVIRENYNLDAYGYGCSRVKKDRVVRQKYPEATIYPLLGRREPENMDLPLDSTPDCRTSPVDRVKQTDKSFYLVEKEDRQLLVTVTDIFVETRPLEWPAQGNCFRVEDWCFVKCNYEIGI